MTVYLVISLPKIPYIHRIYMVLACPTHKLLGMFVRVLSTHLWWVPNRQLLACPSTLNVCLVRVKSMGWVSCMERESQVWSQLQLWSWPQLWIQPTARRVAWVTNTGKHHSLLIVGVDQNRIYTPYMAVYLVIPLPKIPYMHRIYMVLANPTHSDSFHSCDLQKADKRVTCVVVSQWCLLHVRCTVPVQVWNDSWVAEAEEDQSMYYWLLGFTGAAYASSITLAGQILVFCNTGKSDPCLL